jgi:hypothetical protein
MNLLGLMSTRAVEYAHHRFWRLFRQLGERGSILFWLQETSHDPDALDTTPDFLLGVEKEPESTEDKAFFRKYQKMDPQQKTQIREMLEVIKRLISECSIEEGGSSLALEISNFRLNPA